MRDGIKRQDLLYESNYYSSNCLNDKLLVNEMIKTKIVISKHVYLGLKILDLSKIKMYEFLYVYINKKCGKKLKLKQILSPCTLKPKIFTKILRKMQKTGLIPQVRNYKNLYQWVEAQEVLGIKKDEFDGVIIK